MSGNAGDRTIFVYGSLLQGESNHRLLDGQTFIGEGTVRDFGLFVTHDDYPYAAALSGARIAGEVYCVDAATGAYLDRFEGSDGYAAEPVWVRLSTGQLVVAEIYLVPAERIAEMGARRYPAARWTGPRPAGGEQS